MPLLPAAPAAVALRAAALRAGGYWAPRFRAAYCEARREQHHRHRRAWQAAQSAANLAMGGPVRVPERPICHWVTLALLRSHKARAMRCVCRCCSRTASSASPACRASSALRCLSDRCGRAHARAPLLRSAWWLSWDLVLTQNLSCPWCMAIAAGAHPGAPRL